MLLYLRYIARLSAELERRARLRAEQKWKNPRADQVYDEIGRLTK